MPQLLSTLRSLVREKMSVTRKENELLAVLNRELPSIGYKIVPTRGNGTEAKAAPRSPESARTLECPHCDRRFALPFHLGRHVAATHKSGRRRAQAAASRIGATRSAGRSKRAA
jgi:hypothetical protein